MLSPQRVESAIQKLLPTLRDGSRAKKLLDLLEHAPTAKEWAEDMGTEIADKMDADPEEIEGAVMAVFAIGLLIGSEAEHVKID